MNEILTPSNITFTLGLFAIIFSVFNYFKNPQIFLDKKQALDKKEVESKASLLAAEVHNKALILATDLAAEKHTTERRFTDIGDRMNRALTLAENHTHTVDIKVDKLTEVINLLAIQVGKLETKIDERIPPRRHPDVIG